VLGLVWSVQELQNVASQANALVTPIEDVFEDIKGVSGGEIVDIRIA
jgi:hypothetical protein